MGYDALCDGVGTADVERQVVNILVNNITDVIVVECEHLARRIVVHVEQTEEQSRGVNTVTTDAEAIVLAEICCAYNISILLECAINECHHLAGPTQSHACSISDFCHALKGFFSTRYLHVGTLFNMELAEAHTCFVGGGGCNSDDGILNGHVSIMGLDTVPACAGDVEAACAVGTGKLDFAVVDHHGVVRTGDGIIADEDNLNVVIIYNNSLRAAI